MSAALTKAIMDSWKPWDLPQGQLTSLADTLLDNSLAAESTVDGMPTTSWNGASRTAANTRASEQSAWAKKVAAKVDDLKTALDNAAADIDSGKTAVNGALLGATLQRCILVSESDPSWTMRYVPKEGDDLTPEQMAEKARQMTSFVKQKADELAASAAEHAALIKTAIANVNTIAPPGLTLSAQDGRRHAHMGDDGWTQAEAAAVGRSLTAAGLSEDQIRRLMNGEKLTDVPRGAQEYLHMFYGNLNENDLVDLKTTFDKLHTLDGDLWSRNLGQGLVTLSNENVGDNTGYGYLPEWARDWATTDNWSERDLSMAALLGNSGGVPPGEKFGTDLIRKASSGKDVWDTDLRKEIAGRSNAESLLVDYWDKHYTALNQLLDVGTRNHEASAAILSGVYADGTELEDYDRDQSVANLLRRDWADNGETAGELVKWIREYGGSGDHTKIELADRAFSGLFDATTENSDSFKSLMNADHDKNAIGQINPYVAQALREASLPYLNILAGGDSEVYGHPAFDPAGDSADVQRRTARLFTLIASDNTYGTPTAENPDGTGAGADLYRDILEQTIRNGAVAGHDFEADPDTARSLARISATLRELGQAGLYGAEYDLQLDENVSTDEENATGSKVRNIVSSASAGLTAVPHPAAIAAGAAGTAAAPWLLPAESAGDIPFRPPTGTTDGGDYDTATHDEIRLTYGALSALDGIPDIEGKSEAWYDSNGDLKPLSVILSEYKGDPDTLLSSMERALPDGLTASLRAGNGTGKNQGRRNFDPTDPDNYDDMILNGS